MNRHAITATQIFDGERFVTGTVLLESGRISALASTPPAGWRETRLPADAILAPGLVDLQVNGGGGVLFNDAIDSAGLRTIAVAHARHGTTTILPTLISGTRAQLRAAIDLLHAGIPGVGGLHLEGPFINPARRGIHPAEAVIPMTDEDVILLGQPHELPLLVTLAPEVAGAARIRRLAAAGVHVFLGHSEASAEQAAEGFAAGARGATHLFNAMSQLASRAPGLVGATLATQAAFAGIIADGHHVHPQAIAAALAAKRADRLFLVSDAMPTAASSATAFDLGGQLIRLRDGKLTDDAGTLAGAHLTMAEAVRFMIERIGCPPAQALRMATRTPAEAIGRQDVGHIAAGAAADLVALDASFRPLAVWVRGEPVVSVAD